MKSQVEQLLGQYLSGAVIKANRRGDISPSSMLILVLDNGSTYEFYSSFGRIRPVYLEIAEPGKDAEEFPSPAAIQAIHDWGGELAENALTVWRDAAGRHWRKRGDSEPECVREAPPRKNPASGEGPAS